MAVAKSPFFVIQDFLSAKHCELIVDSLGFYSSDTNVDGDPIKMVRHEDDSEELIFNHLEPLIPNLEQYYGFDYQGTERMSFEFLGEGTVSEPLCENSNYVRKKWARTKNRDISGIIFLSDYQDKTPFDTDYEVYGGKLEFPQHGFGFNPIRGTMIIYPSGPHFINATANIIAGDLYQVRFHIAGSMPYLYNPKQFPGTYVNWFKGMM